MVAPPLLTLRGARVGFGGRPLFEDLDVHIRRGEHLCLVGRNGSGKTTLMRALLGILELDAGERFAQPGVRLGHLPQEPAITPEMTAAEYVSDGVHPAHRVDAMLSQLDLDGNRRLGTLSGGELRRAGLARAFVDDPDVLLLDEPTNHLDLPTIEWLERKLRSFEGAFVMVSHDRAILAAVTNGILWLDRGRLRRTDRGFAAFEEWSEAVLNEEEKEARRLDVRIAQETRWLLRGITARRRRNQGRLRNLERLRQTRAALLGGRAQAKLIADEGKLKSRLVIEAKDISKAFDSEGGRKTVVARFSTRVLRGDRIGIIGPNGAGKTTLLRMLAGDLAPDEGSVRIAKNLRRAYFDQHRARLNPAKSLKDTLCEGGGDTVWVHGRARHVIGYLKDFLFDPRQAESPVGTLSGGERNRLLLAKILAEPAELLILDEPTNDLDMDTLDLLEDMLGDYSGTLLLVSHDRAFLDRIVTSTIALEGDGRVTEYAGGYTDYLAQRPKGRAAGAAEASAPSPARGRRDRDRPRPRARARLTYKDQLELDRLPGQIAEMERAIRELEHSLADVRTYARGHEAFEAEAARLADLRAQLARAEERWLELETRREVLARERGAEPT